MEGLAGEHRRILSDWRAVLLLRRATAKIPAEARRWANAPSSTEDVHPILRRLEKVGELKALPKLPYLYQVTTPYARTEAVEETEVLMELHPYAVLSYSSALAFHEMTNELPKEIHASIPDEGAGGMHPIGTRPQDWEGRALVRGRVSDRVMGRSVEWHRLAEDRLFGAREYSPHGYPVRVTTPERTLLDGLLHPDWCGGFDNVLRSWAEYKDLIKVDAVVEYVELFGVAVLRQRVGFILEELGLSHPALREWPARAQRGSSSRLFGSAPFAPVFSERWKLSINAPVDVLHEGVA